MVELRKRKTPPQPATTSAPKKTTSKKADLATKPAETASNSKASPPKQGDTIDLKGFGGDLQLSDGDKSTLKDLMDISVSGVVMFTYPKADTPGCTKQACLFRDSYRELTASGFTIYGLSADPHTANAKFKNKYSLQYNLISSKTLIEALGFKKPGSNSTVRGVIVIDKQGKILASKAGGPADTVATVMPLVESFEKLDVKDPKKAAVKDAEWNLHPTKGGTPIADVAAQVADTAQTLDSGKL